MFAQPVGKREQLEDALDTAAGTLDIPSSHSVEDIPSLSGLLRGHGLCDNPNEVDDGDPANTYIPTSGWDEIRHAGGGRRGGAMAHPFFNSLLDAVPGGGLIPALTGRDTFNCEVSGWDRIGDGISGAIGLASVLGPLLGGLGSILRGGCFVAGTPVQMADGSSKPIEQVKTGDRVQSRDEKTGKATVKKVERVTVRQVNEVETVTFAARKDGVAAETIVTTREHPFYVEGKGFIPAGKLCIGNAVVTRAGPALVVKAVTFTQASGIAVYNMTVADTHTYFVGKANGGTWVHNVPCTQYFKATLTPGIGGRVVRGRPLTIAGAVKEVQNGEDVMAISQQTAKQLTKKASGINRAIGPEIHGNPADGFRRHFHPDPRNGSHIFY